MTGFEGLQKSSSRYVSHRTSAKMLTTESGRFLIDRMDEDEAVLANGARFKVLYMGKFKSARKEGVHPAYFDVYQKATA